MRKFFRLMLSMVIILGIAFSIVNFISTETEAIRPPGDGRGAWEIVNGNLVCGGDGNECDLYEQGQ